MVIKRIIDYRTNLSSYLIKTLCFDSIVQIILHRAYSITRRRIDTISLQFQKNEAINHDENDAIRNLALEDLEYIQQSER